MRIYSFQHIFISSFKGFDYYK